MKAIVYGYTNGEHCVLGELRLRGDKIVYAIHPKCGNADVAKRMLADMVGESRLAPTPEAYLEATPHMYQGAYLRAKFVPDTRPVAKEFQESEHPRAEDGKFTSGGGGAIGAHGKLFGGSNEMGPDAKAAAEEYDQAPEVGPGAKEAWKKLADHTEGMYNDIAKKVKIERVTGQPYASAEEMNADIANGTFKVTTDNSEHPLWDQDQNWKFRVVHDYIGHYQGQNDFSLEGERKAFLEHARYINDADARKAAQAEIFSQASAYTEHGNFQRQKVYLPKVEIRDEGLPQQSYRGSVSAKEFIEARNKNPRIDMLSKLTEKDLNGHTLILNEAGSAGAVLAPNGDIQNVFRNPSAPRGAGTAAAMEAVKHGGFMLDCYEYERKGRPGLPELYKKLGFVETGRMNFDPQFRPEWAKGGRTPDVVFMAYRGGDRSSSPKSKRYYGPTEWAKAKQDSAEAANKVQKYDESQPRSADGKFSGSGKFDAGVHGRTLDEMRLPIGEQLRRQNERRRQRRPHIPADSPLGRTLDQEARWAQHHPVKAALSLEDENKKIEENRGTYGSESHLFERAEYTAGNGHPRCIRCGDEEPEDGLCIPELHKWAKLFDDASATWAAKWSV